MALESGERIRVAEIVPFHVRDGDFQNLAGRCRTSEWSVGGLHANVDVAADESQASIAEHRAGEKSRFKENLETVANAENQAAAARETFDGAHHRGKTGNRPRAQVVAESEAARNDDGIAGGDLFGAVPEEFDGLAKDGADGVVRVVVAIRAGKHYDAKFHREESPKTILTQRGNTKATTIPGRATGIQERGRFFFCLDFEDGSGLEDFDRIGPLEAPDAADLTAFNFARRFAAQPGLFTWRPRAMASASAGISSVTVEPAAM